MRDNVLACLCGGLRWPQLTRSGPGGHLCAHDGDDRARPIAPDPHVIAEGVREIGLPVGARCSASSSRARARRSLGSIEVSPVAGRGSGCADAGGVRAA